MKHKSDSLCIQYSLVVEVVFSRSRQLCKVTRMIFHKASNVLVIVSFPLCGCLVKLDTV